MKLTVIVPVYNTAIYLEDCLNSILAKNITDMEIVAINDASTDHSGSILDAFRKKDKRVKPVHLTKNKGIGLVRNKGIELAKGQWIAFLDSDDLMLPEALNRLLETADSYESDIVIGSMDRRIDLPHDRYEIEKYKTSQFLNFSVFNTNIDQCPNLINIPSSCSVLYSRDFLIKNDLKFKRKFQEDHDFVLNVILDAKTVSVRGDVPYVRYRKRLQNEGPKSITSSEWDVPRFGMMVDHLETVVSLLNDKKYLRKIGNIKNLRKTRFSFYLGTFSNHILRQVFQSGDVKAFHRHLDRMSEAFKRTNLQETGLDLNAESLEPTQPVLSRVGFYQLALCLIVEKNWEILSNLLNNRALSVEIVAGVMKSDSTSAELRDSMLTFLDDNPDALIKSKVPLPNLVPPCVQEVWIHIGMTKTGSTALQNFLEANRDNLDDENTIYPSTGIFHEHRNTANRTAGHHGLIDAIKNQDLVLLERFHAEIANKGSKKLILSTENFFHCNAGIIHNLQSMIGNVPTKIVVYLRRQDWWLESYYAESISGSHNKDSLSFSDFVLQCKAKLLNYFEILEAWAEAFGTDNIIVRPYNESGSKNDVVGDFCQIAKIDATEGARSVSTHEANISPLSKQGLILLREMNKLPFKGRETGYQPFVRAFIDKFGRTSRHQKVHWFQDNERHKLLDEFKQYNSKISKKYLGGKPVFSLLCDKQIAKDKLREKENIKVAAEDLEFAMKLYDKFHDTKPSVTKLSNAANKPVKLVGKIYFASRGVPIFEQVIDWISPVYDRFFGGER